MPSGTETFCPIHCLAYTDMSKWVLHLYFCELEKATLTHDLAIAYELWS